MSSFVNVIAFPVLLLTLVDSSTIVAEQSFDTGWVNLTRAQFDNYQVTRNGVLVNNLSVNEESGDFLDGDLPVLHFGAAVRNSSGDGRHFSIQTIGLKEDGSPAFAIRAEPSFGQAHTGRTEEIQTSFVINHGGVRQARTFMLRIVGDF